MKAASLQSIATAVAQERSLAAVLHTIVSELAAQSNAALTRIWLLDDADLCETCPAASVCPGRTQCLHLAASAGNSLKRNDDWSRIDGYLQRVPLNVGKVGRIGASGQSILLEDATADRQWIVDQQWAHEEGIVSFAGHPLIFRGSNLGVLAIFSRDRLDQSDFQWLRAFADQAATAIANARAFEQIERLQQKLTSENRYLREEVDEAHAFGEIIGQSAALQKLHEQIGLVAPTDASVMILGESGTGKELVARAIHQRSQRSEHPLVKVNCAAVPRDLFESEFFGHIKGSFTGAVRDRIGRFQLADGGTLFLDEVSETPLDLQGKLLRVLQEGQLERVGDDKTRSVNVRVIAASNRDLEAEVAAGRFRKDLYFRLSVFPIHVVPLRERTEDIAPLAKHFLQRCCRQMHRAVPRMPQRQIAQLRQYAWPGNVRELQNVIERAVISCQSGELEFDRLVNGANESSLDTVSAASKRGPRSDPTEVITMQELRALEKANLVAALERSNGKIYGSRGAAELLGIPATTLASKMKLWRIKKPR